MVALPTFLAVTTPFETVAIVWSEELQVTVLSVASSGLTVAVRVIVSPARSEAVVLFNVTEVTSVATTVIWQVAVLLPALAVIVASPTFLAITTPFETVAIVWSDELQVTVLSVASSGLTVAVRVTLSPAWRETSDWSSSTDKTSTYDGVTSTEHIAVTYPTVAAIVAFPTSLAVMIPSSTSTTLGLELTQNTRLSVALLGVILTVSISVSPTFIWIEFLLIVTDDTGTSTGPFSSQEMHIEKEIKNNNPIVLKNALNFITILF